MLIYDETRTVDVLREKNWEGLGEWYLAQFLHVVQAVHLHDSVWDRVEDVFDVERSLNPVLLVVDVHMIFQVGDTAFED